MKKQNQIKHIESQIKNLSENLREMLKYGSNETTRDYSREIRSHRETLKALKS